MVQTISHQFNTHVKRLSLSASVVIITAYCYSILPPVHSKLMSHYQLSILAIYGLEHSETDMNS